MKYSNPEETVFEYTYENAVELCTKLKEVLQIYNSIVNDPKNKDKNVIQLNAFCSINIAKDHSELQVHKTQDNEDKFRFIRNYPISDVLSYLSFPPGPCLSKEDTDSFWYNSTFQYMGINNKGSDATDRIEVNQSPKSEEEFFQYSTLMHPRTIFYSCVLDALVELKSSGLDLPHLRFNPQSIPSVWEMFKNEPPVS